MKSTSGIGQPFLWKCMMGEQLVVIVPFQHFTVLHVYLPKGGCNISPLLSQVPMGWISDESTRRQKSLVLSLPSRRRRRRVPISPITVAMHTEVEFLGSRASTFIPILKSLVGGTRDYTHKGKRGDCIRLHISGAQFSL